MTRSFFNAGIIILLCLPACREPTNVTAETEPDQSFFVPPTLTDRSVGSDAVTDAMVHNGDGPITGPPCANGPCPSGTRCEEQGDAFECVRLTCAELMCGENERCRSDANGAVCEDIRCESDLDCPTEEYCDTRCMPDNCEGDVTRCDGANVMRCRANGSEEIVAHTCSEENTGFLSMCREFAAGQAACTCRDHWDCPNYMRCTSGRCVGEPEAPTCRLEPAAFVDSLPTPEIVWGGSADDPVAADRPFGPSTQVVVTPLVANLDDDNGDGRIDSFDIPEIVFLSFCESNFTTNGILRAIHGGGPSKGMDAFAVLGDQIWREGDALPEAGTFACSDGNLDPTATLAIGDLDPGDTSDGRPEIIASHERNGLVIFDNTGNALTEGFVGGLDEGPNPAPSIANLDGRGFAEIIVGRSVITVGRDDAGNLEIRDRFQGRGPRGTNPQGALSCVADLLGTGRQQIIGGSTVYRWPEPPAGASRRSDCVGNGGAVEPMTDDERAYCDGHLVIEWSGRAVNGRDAKNEGYCAVADVLGIDPTTPPDPTNPLDGQPELVLVANGSIQVFEGVSGRLRVDENMGLGMGGGAPNVDDFDGDGFPEIGSAFSNGYAMLDLQRPSDNCSPWPDALEDSSGAGENQPRRQPGGPACQSNDDCRAAEAVCNRQRQACVCLHNGWKRVTEDNSSRVTGSTLFDFNGDGAAEVIYNDECWFRIYDGLNGQILFKEPSESRTRVEYPIVADVDNDGNAEIVFSTSTESGFCSQRGDRAEDDPDVRLRERYNSGIEVWGDPNDRWVSARRIWNQHSYHVTQIREDGRVPAVEPPSWSALNGRLYNTYRSQPRSIGSAPDLVIKELHVAAPGDGCGDLNDEAQVTIIVENQGDLRIGAQVIVRLSGVWNDQAPQELQRADGTPVQANLGASLEPGRQLRLSIQYNASEDPTLPGRLPDQIVAKADAGGDPVFGQERECIEDNNTANVAVVAPEGLADLRIDSLEATAATCPRTLLEATIANVGSQAASNFDVVFYGGDPQRGGQEHVRTTIVEPLEPGATRQIDAVSNLMPFGVDVTIYAVVDPANAIPECRDDNNGRASAPIQCIRQ